MILPIDSLPKLQEYLSQYSVEERKTELANLRSQTFTVKDSLFFLVSYNCGNKLCDFILINKTGNSITSRPLEEASIYMNYQVSPDQKRMAIHFGRQEGNLFTRDCLIVINIDDLANIIGDTENGSPYYSDLLNKKYIWPILDYSWIDNSQLKVTIPEIGSSSYEEIKKWQTSPSQNKRSLIFHF